MSTAYCDRRKCSRSAYYRVVGSMARLCPEHAAQVCLTDVVAPLPHHPDLVHPAVTAVHAATWEAA